GARGPSPDSSARPARWRAEPVSGHRRYRTCSCWLAGEWVMKTLTLVLMGSALLALTATQIATQSGDRAEVERVQNTLKQMGHDPGPIDGVMGAHTRDALRAYQKKNGLDATGRLDDATLAKPGQTSSQ